MAFAHPALRDDGKEIDRADTHDVDDEPLSQPVHRRALSLWRGARAAEKCEPHREAEQQGYGNENRPNWHVDAEYRAADIFVTGTRGSSSGKISGERRSQAAGY